MGLNYRLFSVLPPLPPIHTHTNTCTHKQTHCVLLLLLYLLRIMLVYWTRGEQDGQYLVTVRISWTPHKGGWKFLGTSGNLTIFGWTIIKTCWCFVRKKIIFQPQEVKNPPFSIQRTLTHYILRLVMSQPHPTPNICLKLKQTHMCYF